MERCDWFLLNLTLHIVICELYICLMHRSVSECWISQHGVHFELCSGCEATCTMAGVPSRSVHADLAILKLNININYSLEI